MAKRVHFIGICGAGMSGVALMMREAGWEVSGSDEGFYPPVSDLLRENAIPCTSPHAVANIPAELDLIVVGKHAKLTEANPEVAEAFRRRDARGVRVASYPEVVQELTANAKTIVVAGSFGKSTTTALTAWILDKAGMAPGFFVGAVPSNFTTNARLGEGQIYVLEGDEYPSANWDPTSKFEYYNPQITVITSGEHDHFNVFPTLESYLAPFERLVDRVPPAGCLILSQSGAHLVKLAARSQAPVIWTGLDDKSAFVSAHDVEQHGPVLTFRLTVHGTDWGAFTLPMLGRHNVENAVQAVAAALQVTEISPETLREALATYRGLRRRLEAKVLTDHRVVYEDLSSSRAKAMAALQAVRDAYPTHRLHAIFQPHTFSFRSPSALEWYPGMFAAADAVTVVRPPNFKTDGESKLLNPDQIFEAISSGNGCPCYSAQTVDEMMAQISGDSQAVLIMTSGGMDGMVDDLVERLSVQLTHD